VAQGEAALRRMRILHAVFFLSVVLLAQGAEQMAGTATGYSTIFLGMMIYLAIFDGLIAYYFRRKRLHPALDKLRRDPNDAGALKEWRIMTLLSLSLTFSIALYGFVLRFFGAGRPVSWPFFLLALLLMVVWRPQLELGADVSGTPANQ
jgi:hypothetical protein